MVRCSGHCETGDGGRVASGGLSPILAEQIGARVQFFAPRLLGRHVGDGSQHGTGAGHQILGHPRRCYFRALEIGDLRRFGALLTGRWAEFFGCRGRDDHCWLPPAQIRTSASTHTAPASDDWRQSAA